MVSIHHKCSLHTSFLHPFIVTWLHCMTTFLLKNVTILFVTSAVISKSHYWTHMPPISILVACTPNGGIGIRGTMPWYLPPDLMNFQKMTSTTTTPGMQNAVIMGRKTWDSLPKKPLNGRRNVVVTRAPDMRQVESYPSLDTAIHILSRPDSKVETIFIIGGGELYQTAIRHPLCSKVYLTMLVNDIECDTYFPLNEMDNYFELASLSEVHQYKNIEYVYMEYHKKPCNTCQCIQV